MAKQSINVGTTANDKKGDSLRAAFQKVNSNFTELYTALGLDEGGLNIGAFEFTGSVISTTDSSAIVIDQATIVTSDLNVGGDILPQTANGGDLGSSTLPWRSLYVSNNTIYIGGVPIGLDANGNLTVNGGQVNAPGSTLVNGAKTVSLGSDGLLNVAGPVTLPNTGELRPSTTAYDAALAGWEFIRGGEIQFYIDNNLATAEGWPMINWHPTGVTAQGYLDFLLNAWVVQQTGGTLIITPPLSSAFYQQLRASLNLIKNTYSGIGSGVSIAAGYNKSWHFNNEGDLTIPGDIKSQGNINIEINLGDSTKRIWQFGEDGQLTFPDGTVQSTAGGGVTASSSTSFTNKTINIAFDQGNTFQIQGNSITSYSGSGAVVALTDLPTLNGINVNNSSLTIDGGTGNYYWRPTAFDGTGTIHKAGIYKSNPDANNALFTFGANSTGSMSVAVEGSLFIGTAMPSNNGGLNTDYPGWLVVQSGGKFGGDINTRGSLIFDDAQTGAVVFADGSRQSTAADFGYLDLDKDTIKGTAGYQYTFNTDGYFTSSTSSESPEYFFVAYNSTNLNIAAGWTVVGANCNTTVSSTVYPVAGYPGVIRVNLTATASGTVGFYPVTVTSPDRLKVQIQPNPGNASKFGFATSGLTFPDTTVQTTAWRGIPGPYADDAAAASAGVAVGYPYHKTGTSGQVFVRLA